MRYLIILFGLSFLPFSVLAVNGLAESGKENSNEVGAFATLTLENDLFAGKDGGYTNGIGYSWGYGPYADFADTSAPEWLLGMSDFLFIERNSSRDKAVSFSIFQAMQTPENIEAAELIENDLPYAGLLGWRGTLYAWDNNVADQFSVILGVVGPASLAEDMQKVVHRITGSDKPQGWDNQLHNEVVFQIRAQRSWRFDLTDNNGFGTDFLTFASGGIGTFASEVAASAMVRFGSGLEETFPAVSILPGRDINPLAGAEGDHFYMFLGAQAHYIFNDIFVDGNTFRNSHSVTLKHEGFTVSAGAVWNWEKWGLLFSVAETSSNFEERDGKGRFGSLSVSYRF